MSTKLVGYTNYTKDGEFFWYKIGGFPPEKLKMSDHIKGEGKFCPALNNIFKNTYVIRSPFDLNLNIKKTPNGSWWVEVLPDSSLNPDYFNKIFSINELKDQNNKDWPLLNLSFPFTFISDDDVYLEILPPLLEYNDLPGVVMGGTFSIYEWHRQFNWGFEWREITKNLKIKRGDPIAYVRFNPRDRNDKVKLKEIPITDDIKEAIGCNKVKTVITSDIKEIMTHNGKHRKRRLIKSHIRYILDRFI